MIILAECLYIPFPDHFDLYYLFDWKIDFKLTIASGIIGFNRVGYYSNVNTNQIMLNHIIKKYITSLYIINTACSKDGK